MEIYFAPATQTRQALTFYVRCGWRIVSARKEPDGYVIVRFTKH